MPTFQLADGTVVHGSVVHGRNVRGKNAEPAVSQNRFYDPHWSGGKENSPNAANEADISMDAGALEDHFDTGARSNQNSNKRKPFVNRAAFAANKKPRVEEDTATECSAAEEDVQDDFDAGVSPDDEKIQAVVEDYIGGELHEFMSKKCVKSLRDPISKKVSVKLDSWKQEVVPMFEGSTQTLAAEVKLEIDKGCKKLETMLVKVRNHQKNFSSFVAKSLGAIDSRVARIEEVIGGEKDE